MSCENVQELISLFVDGRMPEAERDNVLAHAGACRDCAAHLAALETNRATMRRMAQAPMPAALATRLSVLASHERERQLGRVNLSERLRRIAAKIDLTVDNLMRPVALPVTGGVLTTLLAFGLIMPSLSFSHPNGGYDFSTAPQGSLVANPWDLGVDEDAKDFPLFGSPDQPKSDYVNIVNMTIDESGRVADWSIIRGQLTDEMKTIIMFSRFEPATTFGLPTSGTIQVRQSLPPCKYTSCSATVRG
jgi:hypothetical protein